MFPISWAQREEDNRLYIQLKVDNDFDLPDMRLVFQYDLNTNLITSITFDQ